MASKSDVRAILSLPQNPVASTSAAPKKPPPTRKPEGISRELYSLIGDSAPSLVAQYARPKFKPKLDLSKGKSKWTLKPFTNGGRKDKLQLKHWVKAGAEPLETEETSFSQYNRPSQVYEYSEEDYMNHLQDDEWTKEETDYLFSLAREYDLRFLVMADRYEFPGGTPRRIEDLQERYYSVCRRLIRNRPWAGDESSKSHTLASYQFDLASERMRKEYLRGLFNRTPNQIAEEEALYVEVKRLEANESRWKKDRDELLRTLAGIESGLPNLNANWDVQNGVPQMFSDRDRKNLNKRRDGGIDTTFLGLGGSASLLPKRDRVYDAQNCITRLDPANTSNKSSSQPVHLRSSRIPFPKAHLHPKITAILAENGISISRLVMPTRANIERMENLQAAAASLLEVKKNVDRVDQEIRMLRAQRDSAREDSEMMEQSEDGEPGHSGVSMKHLPSQVRKRSMSISSNGTSTTARGSTKRSRRD